jgi:DNA-directed RNA polymerase subunit RPC12/RpoP
MGMLFRRAAQREARAIAVQEEIRRSIRSTRLAVATLACERCDAPIAIGDSRLELTNTLVCPYCRHQAPVRDFLSLAPPTRPTRVIIRVSAQAGAATGA